MRLEDLHEHRRVYNAKRKIAVEHLQHAIQEHEAWKKQVEMAKKQMDIQERSIKMFIQIILEKDDEYRQEQERRTVEYNRLLLREYKSLRGDAEQKEKSLGHVRSPRFKGE